MTRDWEQYFRSLGHPPGKTETDRCDNAVAVVKNATRSHHTFSTRNIEVFAQGSYRNGTNVRADSDVDVCVRCMDVCFYELGDGVSYDDTGLVDASYSYLDFKRDVGSALRAYLGSDAVERGNKAFDLHENSYRVDADVVATFEHRRYYRDFEGRIRYWSGTELHPDNGGRIINWPEQNYSNGVTKNSETGTRYKRMVRVLKALRNEMAEVGNASAIPIPSYLIECLVWNAPNSKFGSHQYKTDLAEILAYLYEATGTAQSCDEWGEVNELKYLFRPSQPWTREQARDFVNATWNYVGVLG